LSCESRDSEIIKKTANLARFSVNNPAITFVFLILVMVAGYFSYNSLPQRKDPDVPVRQAAIQVPWPGNRPEDIELQITKKVEEVCGANKNVKKVESTVQPGLSITYFELDENIRDSAKEFDDIGIKLANVGYQLPPGAGPVIYIKDFGDTSALMLTVASPPITDLEIQVRARPIADAILSVRKSRPPGNGENSYSVIFCHPGKADENYMAQALADAGLYAQRTGLSRGVRILKGEGFAGLDFVSRADRQTLEAGLWEYTEKYLKPDETNPDSWMPVLVQDTGELQEKLRGVAPDKYTYREMDDFTRVIADGLRTIPSATTVDRKGVLGEAVYLQYSQDRLAAYGLNPARLSSLISARNIPGGTGALQSQGQNVYFQTGGQFQSENEIRDMVIDQANGAPLYLRDVLTVTRSYKLPARYLNFLTWRDGSGRWRRSRAVTLSVQMKPGRKIQEFGRDVDTRIEDLRKQVPSDLVIVRTSDQPRQVRENIELFNTALMEAIILVVFVSLVGFWDWRSAFLMAVSIPITLLMTYAGMKLMGLDLQQISIGSLIIALGLLVDNPVVAGDSIKVAMSSGHSSETAAWLGPTKLLKAITFATLTNIAAYMPLAFLPGDAGKFLFSLPLVIGTSLVASVVVAQSFVPVIGRYLLKPQGEISIEDLRSRGLTKYYYRFATFCVHHRWRVLGVAAVLLVAGLLLASRLPTQMFPDDLQYMCTVDVNLGSNATFSLTSVKAVEAEKVAMDVADQLGRDIDSGKVSGGGEGSRAKGPVRVLEGICTFVGGGGPRFWFSIQPELSKQSYAQLVIECTDKHYTNLLVPRLQKALMERVPGARIDVRKLQSGTSFKTPLEFYVTGPDDDWARLLGISGRILNVMRSKPGAMSVRDDWGEPVESIDVTPDPAKASLVGITSSDVARSIASSLDGLPVGTLMEGQYSIPIIARLRSQDRAELTGMANLYVYSSATGQRVPLGQIVSGKLKFAPFFIQRRNFHHCVKPGAFPMPGVITSVLYGQVWPSVRKIEMPAGYAIEAGGEREKQDEQFPALAKAMLISVVLIFVCLVLQFKSAMKPFVVFAAVPFGIVGALFGLILTGLPFGFMAFFGVASLIGVIVSHIIVLFDYVEEMHAQGKPIMEAVVDAGIARLRPVLITVAATVIALFPLAAHGGPLWQPLCYTQIGGLSLATLVTLVIVPTLYCIFVLDLKLVKWDVAGAALPPGGTGEAKEEPVEAKEESGQMEGGSPQKPS
jgi:multidrug efflux pump subunit AcrB